MGNLINLAERVADRSRASLGPAAFFFALECPHSYLAAERAERALGAVAWVPVLSLEMGLGAADRDAPRANLEHIEAQAHSFGLPFVEPPEPLADPFPAARAAAYAGDHGKARRFALAAARMVYCGGWRLDDERLICEAAAVAGIEPMDALSASLDERYDHRLIATTLGLSARVEGSAPAVRIGAQWFGGEDPVGAAAAGRKANYTRHWNTEGHGFGKDRLASGGRRAAGVLPQGI